MALVTGRTAWVVAPLLVIAAIAIGVGVILWVHRLAPGEPDSERRQQKGPDQGRRRLLLAGGAGLASLTAVAVAFPAVRRTPRATDALRTTAWADGVRVVNAEGQPVLSDQVVDGELLTVYPEGAVGDVDAQAVLIREEPSRFVADPERADWSPEGIVVYSKLCTHMACPVGLYQQQEGTILCPCHQASFNVLDGGRAIHGPARRALPQLPIRIDADGALVARGDFSDAVGTGFWGRP